MTNATYLSETILPEWVYIEQVAFSGIIALIGIPGNILIILVFMYSPDRSTTDFMVFSMGVSDLLGSTVCATLNLLRHLPSLWSYIGSKWFCRTYDFLTSYTVLTSTLILGVVAIDRYMKTCRPHSDKLTAFRIKVSCVIVYTVALILLGPSFGLDRFDFSTGACLTIDYESTWMMFMYFVSFLCCLTYVITAVAYICIAVSLNKRVKLKQSKNNYRKYVLGGKRQKHKEHECTSKDEKQPIRGIASNDLRNKKIEINTEKHQSAVLPHISMNISRVEDNNIVNGTTRREESLLKEQRKVNRTTFIMFLITLVNVSSVVFTYVGYLHAGGRLYLPDGLREAIGYTTHTTYMVSYIANPLLYIMMSSRFRERVKKLFLP